MVVEVVLRPMVADTGLEKMMFQDDNVDGAAVVEVAGEIVACKDEGHREAVSMAADMHYGDCSSSWSSDKVPSCKAPLVKRRRLHSQDTDCSMVCS